MPSPSLNREANSPFTKLIFLEKHIRHLKHILARNTPSSFDEGGIPRKFYETAKCENLKDPKSTIWAVRSSLPGTRLERLLLPKPPGNLTLIMVRFIRNG